MASTDGGAKGGGNFFGGSPQFSEGVTVGSKGSFGPYTPPRYSPTSDWDAKPIPVYRYNPVTQSPKQAEYVDAKQTATPARGKEVTLKGVNDGWAGKRAVAQGFDNTGESVRYNPATTNSPKQTAYRDAKQTATPARGKEVTVKGVNDGWAGKRAMARGGGFGGGGLINRNTR